MRQALIVMCLSALVLTGCQKTAQPTKPSPTSIPPGVVRWGVVGVTDVPTLDPALVSDSVSISMASLVYGGLVRLDRDLHVQPDGASRWTISPDRRVYTFTLRRGLRFADGRTVKAADVVGALTRALGPAGAAGAASYYLGAIATTSSGRAITALNARRVQIRLAHPSAAFLSRLAFPASFVPAPGVAARYGPNWTDHAFGFGPYQVASWAHGQSLTLVPNRYYYGGRPAFRRIDVSFYSQAAAMTAYRQGSLDLISGLPAGSVPDAAPGGLTRRPGLALDYLAFNTARLPFYRLKARSAFAAALSPSLVSAALGAAAYPAHTFLPPALGVPVPVWRAAMAPVAYLHQARYTAETFPRLVLFTPRDPTIAPLARALVERWHRTLHVSVAVRALDLSRYNQVLNAHTFDIALVRWGAEYPDPADFLGTQLGSAPDNVTGWSGTRYRRWITRANLLLPSSAARTALFTRAGDLAAGKLPIVPLDEPAVSAVIRPGLKHVYLTPLGTITAE